MEPKNERTTDGAADLKTQVNLNTVHENLQVFKRGIQPARVAILFRIAEKFMNQLVNQPNWVTSLDEMEYILEVMLDAVRRAQGKEIGHGSE